MRCAALAAARLARLIAPFRGGFAPHSQQISAERGVFPKIDRDPCLHSPQRVPRRRSPPKGATPMAASNINRVIITGNLTSDPDLRSLPSGTSVCKLRVACNTRRKDNSTGEWVDKPNYFDVTVWGAQGENCARYLSKGRPVAVDGRLEW